MEQLLNVAPNLDAVFVNSDLMAIAAMDVLREHGRRIPEDVAVVGYDDLSIAEHSNPPLTTVRQNIPLAGKMLAELGLPVSPVAVAQAYAGLIKAFVLDAVDEALEAEISVLGLEVLVTDTVMKNDEDRARLGRKVIGN